MSCLLPNQYIEEAEEHLEPECECGRPTKKRGQPCRRCRLLDGKTPLQSGVIRALQQQPRTCREIVELLGAHSHSVYRVLETLQSDGRVAVIGERPASSIAAPVYGWRGLPPESVNQEAR